MTNLLLLDKFLNQQSKNQKINVLLCCGEVKHNEHEVGTAAAVRDDRVLELEVSTRAFRSFTVPGEGPYVQRWLGESKRNPEKAPKRSKKVPESPRIPEKAPRRPREGPRRPEKAQEGPSRGPSPLLRAL